MRVLILLALIGATVAVPRNIQRVVGGSPTTVEQYPFITNVQYCSSWTSNCWQACGGTLITTRSILSAAQCYYGENPLAWRVLVGTSFASSGGSSHVVSSLIFHENYDDFTFDNNVAILKLATPAVLSDSVGLARIAGPDYNLPDGTLLTIIGWGAIEPEGDSPEQLHHVDVNQINQALCVERYANLKTQPEFQHWPDVTDGMICAGILDVGGKNACKGDNGGPLLHAGDVVVGITSWFHACADATYPGVNTRVSHYTDWITANGSS